MQNPANKKYSASFTASALLYEEFVRTQEILCLDDFGSLMDAEVEENKWLGIKTRAARLRVVREMKKRHQQALPEFWPVFCNQGEAEQRLMLFFLCLKTYGLMLDFHIEVTLKHWKTLSDKLEVFDLQMRLDEIASMDPEVQDWSELTKQKTITVYLRTLKEAGLYKNNQLVRPPQVGSDFWDYFIKNGEAWFPGACFAPAAHR